MLPPYENQELLNEIKDILKVFQEDTSRLYVQFYNRIVYKSTNFFGCMDYDAATVLSRKLCEALLSYLKKKKNEASDKFSGIRVRNLNEREYCGMQYLSGYVLHKLYLKARNNKKFKSLNNQQAMAILIACKSSHENESNIKLVNALSRGGLWYVNKNVEIIFMISEKYFSIKSKALNQILLQERLVYQI